jgi:3',5'-cyclic AMP phosphodiesterase CpdA
MTKLILPYTDDGRLRIAWASDIHLDTGVAEREAKLRQFAVDAAERGADLLVLTGDLRDDGTTDVGLVPSIAPSAYALLGNHDLIPDDAHKTLDQGPAQLALNKTAWGLTTFERAVTVKNVRIIFTDTNYAANGDYGWVESGNMPQTEIDWIEAQLAAATEEYALIFSHHPISNISQWSASPTHAPIAGFQTAMQAMLDGQAIPKAWFHGHDHASKLFRPSTAVPIGAEAGVIGKFGTTPVYSAMSFGLSGYAWTLLETKLIGGVLDIFAQPMVVA